jgi:2,5-furandicarboxylate decarboxylase 1
MAQTPVKTAAMNDRQSIRPFLERLERGGNLLRIGKSVNPHFELSAFLSAADRGPALLFESVIGSELRVVGNVLNSRERMALALEVGKDEILSRIHASIRRPLAPIRVADAAVQSVVVRTAPLAGLPIPTFFPRESRPYITAGVILARDPETGRGNASFARLGVLDARTALVGIAPNHHLALFARRAAASGRPLDIAVVLGAHPAIQMAACLYLQVGDDELECAGRLLGHAVEVVPAKTVDLMVPAGAELILEGVIDAGQPVEEGLISEYHGMYENYGTGFLATFSAQTRRSDAIFQVIEPGYHREHIYLGAVSIAASLQNAVATVVPNVRDIAVTEAGGGRTDIVIQIDTPRPGQARRAMCAAWAAVSLVKRVTVVDADIDPWDALAVEWARTNRLRFERDVLVVPLAGTDRSEPLEEGGLITKVGFDATAKAADRLEGVERALPPPAATQAATGWLVENLPPHERTWLKA